MVMHNTILMPKGTALWLKMNTKLSMAQIAKFCNLDMFTLESINFANTAPSDPLEVGQLTEEEVSKGEKDPSYELKNCLRFNEFLKPITRKYVSIKNKGTNREAMIAYLLQTYPDMEDKDIAKLLGTNVRMVNKIKELEEVENVLNPVAEGACTIEEIEAILNKKKKIKKERVINKKSKKIK